MLHEKHWKRSLETSVLLRVVSERTVLTLRAIHGIEERTDHLIFRIKIPVS